MSRTSGHAAAGAGTRERESKTVRVGRDKSRSDHPSAPDTELSEEPLFSTDKYRLAVPIFQPEQVKG